MNRSQRLAAYYRNYYDSRQNGRAASIGILKKSFLAISALSTAAGTRQLCEAKVDHSSRFQVVRRVEGGGDGDLGTVIPSGVDDVVSRCQDADVVRIGKL